MDNRFVPSKGMVVASVLAGPLIFVVEYISNRSLSQSLFNAIVCVVGALLSIPFYRWVWPDKPENDDNDLDATKGK